MCQSLSVTLPLFRSEIWVTEIWVTDHGLLGQLTGSQRFVEQVSSALLGASRSGARGGPGAEKINLSPFNTFSVDSGSISYADCELWEESRRMPFPSTIT